MYSDNALIRALQHTRHDVLGTVWFQIIAVSGPLTIGAATAFVQSSNQSPQAQALLFAIATLGSLFIVIFLKFLWNLHRAPYLQRNEARDRMLALERQMRSALEFLTEKEESGTYPTHRGWGLVVRNSGVEKAAGCSARIEELEFEYGGSGQTLKRWPTDRPLHWAGQETDAYDIPGGQSAHLNIAYFGDVSSLGQAINYRATLAYRGDKTFRAAHALPEGVGPILVLINLVSEGQKPIYILCKLDVQVMKDLLLAGTTDRKPFECLYFGPDRPTLPDYQSEHPDAKVFR